MVIMRFHPQPNKGRVHVFMARDEETILQHTNGGASYKDSEFRESQIISMAEMWDSAGVSVEVTAEAQQALDRGCACFKLAPACADKNQVKVAPLNAPRPFEFSDPPQESWEKRSGQDTDHPWEFCDPPATDSDDGDE